MPTSPSDTKTPAAAPPANFPFSPGFKTLLLGESGSGKTYSLRTLVDAGLEVFIILTENGMRSINDVTCEQGLHYKYLPPAAPNLSTMKTSASRINQASDLEALTRVKDWDKTKYQQFIQFLSTLERFQCDRCGKDFGMVDDWGHDRALVIDSLSGLSIMAMDLATGSKPVKSPADWGTSMDNLERMILRLCMGVRVHVVLTGHLEREKDEVTGGIKLMASTLGQKLAPKLPRYFDDVIMAQDVGTDWVWATSAPNVSLKTRNLAKATKLPPSFVPLFAAWKSSSIYQTTEEVKANKK